MFGKEVETGERGERKVIMMYLGLVSKVKHILCMFLFLFFEKHVLCMLSI